MGKSGGFLTWLLTYPLDERVMVGKKQFIPRLSPAFTVLYTPSITGKGRLPERVFNTFPLIHPLYYYNYYFIIIFIILFHRRKKVPLIDEVLPIIQEISSFPSQSSQLSALQWYGHVPLFPGQW